MNVNANASEFWTLDGHLAELRVGHLTARVDVSHPELGLQELRLNDWKMTNRLLCVSREPEGGEHKARDQQCDVTWPLAIADAYVRGCDLVTSYQPSADWPYTPQIYWRADKSGRVDGLVHSLSLLVSVQTHLLDTWPRIAVGSHFSCSETLQVLTAGKRPQTKSLTTRGWID
jgi:hypothetical protein